MSDEKITPEDLRKLDQVAYERKEKEMFAHHKQVRRAEKLQANADRRAKEPTVTAEALHNMSQEELARSEAAFLRTLRH